MPQRASSLGEMLQRAAQTYGDHPALVVHSESISYRNLWERARSIAGRLLGSGLSPGDRVAVWLPNSIEFAVLAFGTAIAGMILVPLNTRLKSVDAAVALRQSGAKALFLTESFLGIDYLRLLDSIRDDTELPDLEQVINIGKADNGRVQTLAGWQTRTSPLGHLPEIHADVPAMINFTSGTTSSPKGAVIRHGSFLHIAREAGRRMRVNRGDRAASAMPFYHNGGFVPTLLTSLIFGCTLHTQPRFDPEHLLDTIARERCTLVSGVGTMFTMMLGSPAFSRTDLSSVRAMRITGPLDMRRVVYEGFGRPHLFSLYGMAESTAAVTLTCPEDSAEEQVNTNGKPLPGCRIRIVGPAGEPVPAQAQGEIWIGGPSLMQGYFGDPSTTAEVLTPDGWLRSGDLGYLDERGNLVLVGRIKDMYRSGGENVACPEVEEFLRSHPAVLQAAVLGVPDPRLGEVGFAFVELQPGVSATAEELQDYCRLHLANFKVPRYILFRTGLPTTASGRVQKHELRSEALAAVSGAQL